MLSRISSTLLRAGEGSCGSHIIRGKAHLVGYVLSFDFPYRLFFLKKLYPCDIYYWIWKRMRKDEIAAPWIHLPVSSSGRWFYTGSSRTPRGLVYTSKNQCQHRRLGLRILLKSVFRYELNWKFTGKNFQISLPST